MGKLDLTPEEQRLINLLRQVGWGEAKIIIKNNRLVMVQELQKDYKLTD